MYDENTLLTDLCEGKESAYRYLIDNYKDKIFKTALSFVPFPEDAEDITQEVFIEVFKSIKYFQRKSLLSTWIYRITVNKSINFSNRNAKNNRTLRADEFYLPETVQIAQTSADLASDLIERKQLAKLIYVSLNKLSEKQKVVFVLHKIDGLSYHEISSILGISISSVESLIHRAKLKLQKLLTNYVKGNY